MSDIKKFLDYEGVKFLWSKISMQDYPNNETLMAVINAIDETKADKEDLAQAVLYTTQSLTDEQKTQARENIGADGYNWHLINVYGNGSYWVSENNIDWEKALATPNVTGGGDAVCALGEIADWGYNIADKYYEGTQNAIKNIIKNYDALLSNNVIINGTTLYLDISNKGYYGTPTFKTRARRILVQEIGGNSIRVSIQHDDYIRHTFIYHRDTDEVEIGLEFTVLSADTTLTRQGYIADAKAVGDALKLKVDKSDIATDDEILGVLAELDMLPVVADADGALLSDENENILLW